MRMVAVFIALVVSAISVRAEIRCVDGSTVNVKISDQIFAISINYDSHIITFDEKDITPRRKATHPQCKKGVLKQIIEPVEARSISLLALNKEEAHNIGIPMIQHVPISVYQSPSANSVDLQQVSDFNNIVSLSKILPENLPNYANFFALKKSEKLFSYIGPFMSTPDGILTPGGRPIVFKCYGDPVGSTQLSDYHGLYSMCSVDYNLSPTIAVHYSFSSAVHRIENWNMLDAAVRDFVARITAHKEK